MKIRKNFLNHLKRKIIKFKLNHVKRKKKKKVNLHAGGILLGLNLL